MTGPRLRALALSLPEAHEQETWGHPTFRVGGKIFTSMADDGTTATVKATPERQDALVATDPATFGVADRVGRFGWVTVRLDRVDPDELRDLVVDAWRRTAPKRAVRAFEAG